MHTHPEQPAIRALPTAGADPQQRVADRATVHAAVMQGAVMRANQARREAINDFWAALGSLAREGVKAARRGLARQVGAASACTPHRMEA